MDYKDDLEDLIKKTKLLLDEMEEGVDKTKKMRDNVRGTGNALTYTQKQLTSVVQTYADFAKDTEEQLIRGEKIAEQYKDLAINIGMAAGRSDEMTRSFQRSLVEISKLGFSAQDLNQMIDSFVEKSGRARILDVSETENIAKVVKGMDLSVAGASELAEVFDLMGVSTSDMYSHLNTIVKDSQSIGLNSNKVVAVLQQNMNRMQHMSFASGVKGMTEMAKQAVKMRADVGDLLSMSQKFYEPEAAIEAAANLQMLGGSIAAAFGDPIEMMQLARNEPQKLAEKVGEMTKNMVSFNKETGAFDIPAETVMNLQAAGEALGMGKDSLIDIARQTSKIEAIKMDVSGNILEEDTREGIASLARMDKGGNWVVDFAGAEQKISDIGPEMAKKILSAPKEEEDAIMLSAQYAMTNSEILTNIEESAKNQLAMATNLYPLQEAFMKASLNTLGGEGGLTALGQAAITGFKLDEKFGKGEAKVRESGESFDENILQPQLQTLISFLEDGIMDKDKYEDMLKKLSADMLKNPKTSGMPGPVDSDMPEFTEIVTALNNNTTAVTNSSSNSNISFTDPLNIQITATPGTTVTPQVLAAAKEEIFKKIKEWFTQSFAKGGKMTGKENLEW